MNPSLSHADSSMEQPDDQGDRHWLDDLVELLGASSRHVALSAAWIATGGSLFFSEVLGWRPCLLCWYQRILMYPLAILLAIGIIRRDRGLHLYVLPFSIVGIGTALYHYLLIKTDWLPPPACAVDIPCTVDYLNWFGFINIPFLALTAFVIITCMMLAFAWSQPLTSTDVDGEVVAQDGASTGLPIRVDTANLVVVMIVVGVVLAFMIGSTFV
jgi:disulfide bond formation protein DsbB